MVQRSPCDQTIQSEQSAIHRALFCQDTVEAIFSHLSLQSVIFRSHRDYRREHHDEVKERENRQALASAARISKYISEVALSFLWAQIQTLRPLVGLLPQYDHTLRKLDGEPSDADWGRFEKYAVLVREAYVSHGMHSEQELWNIVLTRYQSIGRFLPRLTALATLYLAPVEDSLSDFFLLSHSLRHISFDLNITGYPNAPDGGVLLTAALERIVAAIPSLSSLTISFVSFKPNYPQISWKIPSFESMRKLDIMSRLTADASMLATIGQFQHLHALSVHINDDCAHLHGCFQALTELSISGRASDIRSFLTMTSPPLLQSLGLFFAHDPSTQPLAQCMSALPGSVPATLSELTLVSSTFFDPMIASAMDVIQPALVFHALTYFRFKFRPLPSISDDDILTALSAFPALTTLRIEPAYGYDYPGPPPVRPTARILPLIAARCPYLDTLELPEVDLAATPALDALPPAPLGHPLRALDMQSDCADRHACMRAAVMLYRLFPDMRLPAIFGEREERGWHAIVRLLEAMQAGRAHADGFQRAHRGREGEGADGGDADDEGEDEDGDMGFD